jgi:hypothetical protein
MFYEGTIDKIKTAINNLITDSDIKTYALAYLEYYKRNYAVERDYKFERTFQLNPNYKSNIKIQNLIDYLSLITGTINDLPDSILSQHDKDTGTHISSFNNKLSYILSDIKAKFISRMIGFEDTNLFPR